MNGGWWLHFNSKTQHCVLIIHQDQLNMTHVMDNEVNTWPLRSLLQHYVVEKHDAIITWHYIKSWQDQSCALFPRQHQRLRNHAVNCNEQTENFKQRHKTAAVQVINVRYFWTDNMSRTSTSEIRPHFQCKVPTLVQERMREQQQQLKHNNMTDYFNKIQTTYSKHTILYTVQGQ